MSSMCHAYATGTHAARDRHPRFREETHQKDEPLLKTLVIGIGNPLLGDDGVGNYVAKLVEKGLPHGLGVDVKEISASGIELVEEMMGYDTAIVVDAVATNGRVGTIRRLKPEQLNETIHFTTPHRINFASAYEFGKLFASKSMPKKVILYGIEIKPKTDFSERLSPDVAEAAHLVAARIIRDLARIGVNCLNT